jgi:hypothetical protein
MRATIQILLLEVVKTLSFRDFSGFLFLTKPKTSGSSGGYFAGAAFYESGEGLSIRGARKRA